MYKSSKYGGLKGGALGGTIGTAAGALPLAVNRLEPTLFNVSLPVALGILGSAVGAHMGRNRDPDEIRKRIAHSISRLDYIDSIERDQNTTEQEKNKILLRPSIEEQLLKEQERLDKVLASKDSSDAK